MAKDDIINLLDNSNITNDLKEAYSFMLLSRGYSIDDLKILDDYVFLVRKKEYREIDNTKETNAANLDNLRKRKQRSLPKNPVCFTSTSDVYSKRDHTLYSFNGNEPVTKGRLVWMIIKLYQEQHNPTFEEASQLFNRELNLLKNTVIDDSSLANLKPGKQKRFYYHESDMLVSKDDVRYAVSNQWTINKMDEIISFACSMGWKVEVFKPETK